MMKANKPKNVRKKQKPLSKQIFSITHRSESINKPQKAMHDNTPHFIYYYKFRYIKETCILTKIRVCIHTQKYIYIHIYISL